MSRLLTAHQHP